MLSFVGIAFRLAIALTCAALVFTATALAEPASLPDLEDEVMCVQCNLPLNQSTSAVAEQEREFIRQEIALGKSKQEIKDALVARFGPAVLAEPQDEGFDLAAYVVPALVIGLALIGVLIAARRWRRPAAPAGGSGELDAADAERLERELDRQDEG